MNRLIASLFAAATIVTAVLPTTTQAHEKKIEIVFSFVATSATDFIGNYSMQGAIYEAGAAEGSGAFYPTKKGGFQDAATRCYTSRAATSSCTMSQMSSSSARRLSSRKERGR